MGVYGPGVGGLVTAISNTLFRTTAPPVLWTPLRAVAVGYPVASRFEPPFSLGARGNRGLAPLIPSLGALTFCYLQFA
ncbi:hypothetical protein YC2023_022494 [Brassica napus]